MGVVATFILVVIIISAVAIIVGDIEIFETMLGVFERIRRAIVWYFLFWGGRRQERASSSPGIPETAAKRGRIRP